jgi:pSer/pThr/pTyr-binding forkhead associated (FHA) protein
MLISYKYLRIISFILLCITTCGLFSGVEEARGAATPFDLLFVIDNSGSMKKNDPQFITPQVVNTFILQLPAETQAGMVVFDKTARLIKPLTLLSGATARQEFIESSKSIDYRGQFTNTPAGIERALYELKMNGRAGAEKGIVFITDGIVDTGDKEKDAELTQWLKEDVASQSKRLGVRIFGIALTEAADFSLIQTLALRTNGEYYRTYAASEISGLLKQIQARLKPPPPPKPALAPLPLLPEPKPQPISPPSPGSTPETGENAPAAAHQSAPLGGKAVIVTEKSAWLISLTMALVIIVLVGALLFLFIQFTRRREIAPVTGSSAVTIPEAHLEDMDGACDHATLALDKARINIGRSKKNDIIIEQPAISSFHATVEFRNMAFFLEDQRSTNGTLLNGRRLEPNAPERLKSGDTINFANSSFTFTVADQNPFGDTVMLSMTALEDPEAEATIVLDLEGLDSKQGLIACMQNHLMQIYGLSPKHKEFVNTYFAHDILDILATNAHENLQQTQRDGEMHCSHTAMNDTTYVACSLPVAVDAAAQWYSSQYGGFTQFIFKWIKSDEYLAAKCRQLCIITFGQDPATWVSITIVPTQSGADPVEIMSVDFLNDEEKASLGLDFDNHGRVV